MRFSLSTNWNALRHDSGEALVDEIAALGFDALELGYHLTEELAAGVRRRVQAGGLPVESVHAYCPVPIGAPHGYPELYLLASSDEDERAMASLMVGRTLTFAASMGAKAVVLHAGRIFLRSIFGSVDTRKLVEVYLEEESAESVPYRRLLAKALRRRAVRVKKCYDGFCLSLEKLLPKFEQAGVALCLENLPSIEAFPDEREMPQLKQRFATPALAYWHDMGHGQVRENLGWAPHADSARALLPLTRGIHIHDVLPPASDHLAPGKGKIDFKAFSFFGSDGVIKVFEPGPDVTGTELAQSLRAVAQAWGAARAPQVQPPA